MCFLPRSCSYKKRCAHQRRDLLHRGSHPRTRSSVVHVRRCRKGDHPQPARVTGAAPVEWSEGLTISDAVIRANPVRVRTLRPLVHGFGFVAGVDRLWAATILFMNGWIFALP